ncbi:MAG: VWA domain-containing protein, partial [Planctomycetes bacterium]|nr:VWA domain-containing protein [Planctomycetota bacterium]
YWLDYINGYMNSTWTEMYRANSAFRYRFGVKTLTNYLLERKPGNSETPELADVPEQPMQAVKDAVNYMVEFIDDLDTDDQISLEIYGTTARHEVDLTHRTAEPAGLSTVSNRLNDMQAGHYDIWTNVGGGLERAIEELGSERARGMSRKMIILLTDGIANVNEDGATGDEAGGAAYALAQAQAAAALGIRIFAVSVGAGANQVLMNQIADIGQGEHFHAEGSIEEYSAELAAIFQQLGGMRPVELIR